ncbi:uncharacterized protein LOC128998543 isoform X2 [Macrosteles quadrilineatus]|uniref:uncharacterized protein LOC128998543 isoform X2 n=1 Tax=Macrosteles quadrilineatus TaxID=74068 RepID=UPI0023E19460|nr:uncharacterized protein LOC128998543 isoform X2 [Macrosteles quadrilineatus]
MGGMKVDIEDWEDWIDSDSDSEVEILIQLRNWSIKWARLKTHQENYWNLHKNWTSLNLNGYLSHQMRRWMHPSSEGAERNTNYRPLYSVKELKEEHLVR